jgi:hypothetical protein
MLDCISSAALCAGGGAEQEQGLEQRGPDVYEINDPRQQPISAPPPPLPPIAALPHAVPTLGYALPGSIEPFSSARSRANWVVGLLTAWILVNLLSLLSGYWQLGLLHRIEAGDELTQEEVSANDLREAAVSWVAVAVYLATVVAFLMWLHRARKNLEPLGALGAQYSSGWAIGAWFLPILNLFRPYQIAQEIYRGSGLNHTSSAWHAGPGSALIGWWWTAWIISGIIDNVSFSLSRKTQEVPALISATSSAMVASVAGIVAALLCIGVVQQITARQEETVAMPDPSAVSATNDAPT